MYVCMYIYIDIYMYTYIVMQKGYPERALLRVHLQRPGRPRGRDYIMSYYVHILCQLYIVLWL